MICLAIRAALSLYTGAIGDNIVQEYEGEELKDECVGQEKQKKSVFVCMFGKDVGQTLMNEQSSGRMLKGEDAKTNG